MGVSSRLIPFCPCEYLYIHLTHTTSGPPVLTRDSKLQSIKTTQFFGTASRYGKVKKTSNFRLPRIRRECAPEFKTLADYVIPCKKPIECHSIGVTRIEYMSLINSKDKNTYLELQVKQIKKLRALRTILHLFTSRS